MLRRPKRSKNEFVAPKEEEEGIERNMILKWNIQEREWGGGVWKGLFWVRTETSDGLL